jgi:SAM-dependent methyltransferase
VALDGDAAALFAGTAAYYARYRPGYPAALVDRLADEYALGTGARVADLGCGTGQLSLPLAARGAHVDGIDPSAEMLRAAAAATPPALAARVRWLAGVAEDLPALVAAPLALVTAAAAFHWMDRDRVLAHCDRLVAPDGGVAIVMHGPAHIDIDGATAAAPWAGAVQEVVRAFLGPERRAGNGVYRAPAERHEVVLARSPFSRVAHWQAPARLERTVDEVIGLQLSTSYCAPKLLGDALPDFVAQLRARLLAACPSGRFVEEWTIDALLARRPRR